MKFFLLIPVIAFVIFLISMYFNFKELYKYATLKESKKEYYKISDQDIELLADIIVKKLKKKKDFYQVYIDDVYTEVASPYESILEKNKHLMQKSTQEIVNKEEIYV